ncbi:MAG: DNA cytosine methyltransferase [Thermoplasmata archaeon]
MPVPTLGSGELGDTRRGRRYTVISLFSGCGGMDLGFKGGFQALGKHYGALPFDIIWANDNDAHACKTYEQNVGGSIRYADLRDVISEIPDRADVVIGGFPCQDISINGLRAGADGRRSGLYRAMVEVVGRCRPKVFVAENVKGLLLGNRESLHQILSAFAELGYAVSHRVYLAADYGVPQMRERVFIVGTAPGVEPFSHPPPVTPKGAWVTSKEAIGDLETTRENAAFNHVWSRAKRSPEQGMRKVKADRPSYTIRAEHHGNTQFHYSLRRRLSVREAARFQTFPDSFVFVSGMRQTERQVGNAVPPVLAWHIANATLACLTRTEPRKASSPGRTRQLSLATL